jgi:hypothetical protein
MSKEAADLKYPMVDLRTDATMSPYGIESFASQHSVGIHGGMDERT